MLRLSPVSFLSLISHRNILHSFILLITCCTETLYFFGFHVTSFSWCSSCPSASSFSWVLHPFSLPFQSWCLSGFHPLPTCPLILLFLYHFNNSCGLTFQLNADDSPISISKPYVSLEFYNHILIGLQTSIHSDTGGHCRLSDIFL